MKKTMTVLIIFLLIGSSAAFAIFSHKSFGRKHSAERVERIRNSPNYRDGKFQNLSFTPTMTSDKNMFQNFWSFIFEKRPGVKPSDSVPAIKTDLKALDKNQDMFIWFGHSSYIIQNSGYRFLIDPVLTRKFPVSLMLKPFKGTDLYSPEDMPSIDFLVITHEHWDHLDYHTAIEIKEKVGKVICPLGVGEYFEYWGYDSEDIIEMDWNDNYHIDNVITVYCLPARHFSNRLFKRDQNLWASFMIDGNKKVYISGDGGYDSHFETIGRLFPDIDLAILENGQYNDDWRHIHLMPDEIAATVKDLNPSGAVTVHNSKFALSRHSWKEPMDNFQKTEMPESCTMLIPMIGEVLLLDSIKNDNNKKWW